MPPTYPEGTPHKNPKGYDQAPEDVSPMGCPVDTNSLAATMPPGAERGRMMIPPGGVGMGGLPNREQGAHPKPD
jgi:hypothetical protein